MEKQENELQDIVGSDSGKELVLPSDASSYPQNPKERTFTEQQLVDIIGYATTLRDADETRRIREAEIRAQLPVSLPHEDKRVIPSKALYRIASDLEIPKKYVDRAVQIKYPSRESMLEDIARFGAKVLPDIQIQKYWRKKDEATKVLFEKYKLRLSQALASAFPGERFKLTEIAGSHTRIIYYTKRKRRFIPFLKKTVAHIWADIHFIGEVSKPPTVEVSAKDPRFLSTCGDSLEELKKEIWKEPAECKYFLYCDYDPEE